MMPGPAYGAAAMQFEPSLRAPPRAARLADGEDGDLERPAWIACCRFDATCGLCPPTCDPRLTGVARAVGRSICGVAVFPREHVDDAERLRVGIERSPASTVAQIAETKQAGPGLSEVVDVLHRWPTR